MFLAHGRGIPRRCGPELPDEHARKVALEYEDFGAELTPELREHKKAIGPIVFAW